MGKHYKALTEFCLCGVRYAAGQPVEVDERSAKKLLASRLIYEVAASAIAQDAATGGQPEGQDDVDKKKESEAGNDKVKQQKPPRDKQVTGGKDK